MKNWLLSVLFLVVDCLSVYGQVSTSSKHFYFGIDNTGDKCESDEFFNPSAMDALGVDFVVYHYHGPNGTAEEEAARMQHLGERFKQKGLKVIVNTETGNWSMNLLDRDGNDWVNQPGGLHLFKFPASVVKSLSQSDAVWGIEYDELEHSQITRNLSLTLQDVSVHPISLAETNGMTFRQADSAICHNGKALVDELHGLGTRYVLSEHVWPVLYHNFARAGFTPVYKQMKEGWSDVWAAVAAGACLQYNRELWACLDLWNNDVFPGHSAAELYSNMLFAYWFGVDKAYVEAVGNHTYSIENNTIALKERGQKISNFTHLYVPKNPRPYTFRDYQPEIAIIRFDDTDWGQGKTIYSVWGDDVRLYWPDWLFGAYNLNASPTTEEWIRAWHTITHGWVKKESLSWASYEAYKGMQHRSFAPANSPIVFDGTVSKELLKTVRLAFLCGLEISSSTLQSVEELVKEKGLVVVTSSRFAPQRFASQYTVGTKAFTDGKGRWILTDDMASNEVKRLVQPFLGKDNEIVCRFKGNKVVRMKISPDGNELQVSKSFK